MIEIMGDVTNLQFHPTKPTHYIFVLLKSGLTNFSGCSSKPKQKLQKKNFKPGVFFFCGQKKKARLTKTKPFISI